MATGIVLYLTYLLWNFTPGGAPPFDPADLVTIGRVDFAAKITFLICIPAYFIAFSVFTFQGYENLKSIGTKELTFGSPLVAGNSQESNTLQMVWQYGVPSELGILAIVSGAVGVIHLIKAFR